MRRRGDKERRGQEDKETWRQGVCVGVGGLSEVAGDSLGARSTLHSHTPRPTALHRPPAPVTSGAAE